MSRKVGSLVVGKLKQGQITPLQEVNSEHFVERAQSGSGGQNSWDVGVRTQRKTGRPVGNLPETAVDVRVHDVGLGRCLRQVQS